MEDNEILEILDQDLLKINKCIDDGEVLETIELNTINHLALEEIFEEKDSVLLIHKLKDTLHVFMSYLYHTYTEKNDRSLMHIYNRIKFELYNEIESHISEHIDDHNPHCEYYDEYLRNNNNPERIMCMVIEFICVYRDNRDIFALSKFIPANMPYHNSVRLEDSEKDDEEVNKSISEHYRKHSFEDFSLKIKSMTDEEFLRQVNDSAINTYRYGGNGFGHDSVIIKMFGLMYLSYINNDTSFQSISEYDYMESINIGRTMADECMLTNLLNDISPCTIYLASKNNTLFS